MSIIKKENQNRGKALFLFLILIFLWTGRESKVYALEEGTDLCDITIETASPAAPGEILAVYKIGEATRIEQTIRFRPLEQFQEIITMSRLTSAQEVQEAIRQLDRLSKEKLAEVQLNDDGKSILQVPPGIYLIEQLDFRKIHIQSALIAVPIYGSEGFRNDAEICLKTSPEESPATGDTQRTAWYYLIMLLSLCIGYAVWKIRQRRA